MVTPAPLPYLEHDGVIAMAHRGFTGRGAPENSLAAFADAVDLGYSYVETDVHCTSDGVLLAFHDSRLDRVTDATGAVADQPWRTVQQARIAGREPIPTLDQILDAWPDLRLNIDCKSAAAAGPLAAAIERHAAHDRVCIASFSDRRRRAVLRGLDRPVVSSAGSSVVTAAVLAQVAPSPLRKSLSRNALRGVQCVQVPVRHGRVTVVDERFIDSVHAAGAQVHVWTINESDEMRRLVDLGVDGIITDRADLLRTELTTQR